MLAAVLVLAGLSLGVAAAMGLYREHRERNIAQEKALQAERRRTALSKFDGVHAAAVRLGAALDTKVGIDEYLRLVAEMRAQLDLINESSLSPKQKKLYSLYRESADDYRDAAELWSCTNNASLTAAREFDNPNGIGVLESGDCVTVAFARHIATKMWTRRFSGPTSRFWTVAWPAALQDVWTSAEITAANANSLRDDLLDGSAPGL